MNIAVMTVAEATQAKLIIKPRPKPSALIKLPGFLSHEEKEVLKNKLVTIALKHKNTRQFLKIFYKVGKPYLFLNRRVEANRRETVAIYKYAEV